MTDDVNVGVGVAQAPAEAAQVPVPAAPPADPAIAGFAKIAAERRSRVGQAPVEVPFGTGTIRIHPVMPATFAFDAEAIGHDPFAAKRMIRTSIVEADRERYDAIMLLPPDNAEGIDGEFLVGFAEQLAEFYTGRPLAGRSR